MTQRFKYIIAIILTVLATGNTFAKRISEAEAYNIALQFNGNGIASRSASMDLAKKDANYYIFNRSNSGFVIVSASDLTDEILGYSKTGTFDKKNIPENMKSLLQSYSEQIDYAEKNNINGKSAKTRSSETKPNIEPLIKSQWDQGYPYNSYCPEKNGQKTLTGCVATAMAQIVAYHKSNYNPVGNINYNTWTEKHELNLDTCAINYNNLCINYNGYETPEQNHEIAKLMKVCGYNVESEYGLNATTATSIGMITIALTNYFNYDKNDAKMIVRHHYDSETSHIYTSQEEWEDDVYNSLRNGNPLPYQASEGLEIDNPVAHAFICDGYENGYFHMNWGWGGSCDGYFKLDALSVAGYDFTSKSYYLNSKHSHIAIINLHPNVLNTAKNTEYLNPNTTYSVNESTLTIKYKNNGLYSGSVKYGLLTVNEQNDTTTLTPKQEILESGVSITESISISDLNLESGITTLIPVIYQKDNIKRITESDIYVAVTPYKSIITENKEDIQPFLDKVFSENFKVTKSDNMTINIEAVNKAYPVLIFNFTGQLVYNGNDNNIKLPKSGLYTVKNGKAATTVVIK